MLVMLQGLLQRFLGSIAAQVLARFSCLCFWPCLLGGQLSSTRIQFRFSPSFVRVRLESTQCSHRCLLHVCSARLCFLQTSTPFARISSAPVKQKKRWVFWERRKNRLRAFRQYSIMCIADHHENRCQLHLHYWKLGSLSHISSHFHCPSPRWVCLLQLTRRCQKPPQ